MLAAIGVLALAGIVGEAELVEVLYQEVVGGVVVGQIVDGGPADVEGVVLGAVEGEGAVDLSALEECLFGELAVIEEDILGSRHLKMRFLVELHALEVGDWLN